MKRGEIRWYKFQRPDKKRPVLIITRNSIIDYLNDVTIAPITSTIRDIPSEVALSQDDGMAKGCAVNFDHIQTVAKNRLGSLITVLPDYRSEEIKKAIIFALEL